MIGSEFTIKYHHRYDLRNWLRSNFPSLDSAQGYRNNKDLEQISLSMTQIYDACMKISRIDKDAGSAYVKYYAEDWERISEAYKKNDPMKMSESLKTLLDAIDVE